MKVIVFGAAGMVGQRVLRECLRDPDVTEVATVSRRPTGVADAKLREIAHSNFEDFRRSESKPTPAFGHVHLRVRHRGGSRRDVGSREAQNRGGAVDAAVPCGVRVSPWDEILENPEINEATE